MGNPNFRLRESPALTALAGVGIAIVIACWLATLGTAPAGAAIAALMQAGVLGATLSIPWLIAAAGLGRLWRPLFATADTPDDLLLQTTAGIATALFLDHLLGVLGAFSGAGGRLVAWGLVLAGAALLFHQVRRSPGLTRISAPGAWWIIVASPALAVIGAACAVAPGYIWPTEANQFDTLAYHLQLPKEWLAAGAIASLRHNVYSHLPSYVEAAYMHLAAMSFTAEPRPAGGAGAGLFAAQSLHAALAVVGALHLRRFIDTLTPDGPTRAGPIAAAVFLACGWVTVVASCAYNEMAALAAFAASLELARRRTPLSARRGVLVGLLTAAAVAAKPTALFMIALPAVAILIAWAPRRDLRALLRLLAPGALVAGVYLAPWLIRNTLATGNPVFPFATGLFGTGHWTAEQAARWHDAHAPEGGLAQRLGLLFSARGVMHAQWSIFFPLVAGALVMTLARARTRGLALAMAAVLAIQVAGRLLLEHQQARFLLPLAIPGAILIGVALHPLMNVPGVRGVWLHRAAWIPLIIVMLTTGANFARQGWHRLDDQAFGGPSLVLLAGPRLINGSAPDNPEGPYATLNRIVPDDGLVYLLGESRALYVTVPTLYHATWDSAPMGDALDVGRDRAGAFGILRRGGVTHVMINFSELRRLMADGWYDPRVTLRALDLRDEHRGVICIDIRDPLDPHITILAP